MSELLKARGVYKSLAGNLVLKDCAFALESGRIVGLLGPNGAGKSTLLKVLAGILRPDGGTVTLRDRPIRRADRARVAYMADHTLLPGNLTVERAARWYEGLFPGLNGERFRRAAGLLPWSGRVSDLSKGQAERLDLALLLSRDADLYLLDEPLGGVDPVERAHILDEVMGFLEEDRTILMATHLVHDIEPILDDVLFLEDGRVVLEAPAEGIRAGRGQSVEECYMERFGGGRR